MFAGLATLFAQIWDIHLMEQQNENAQYQIVLQDLNVVQMMNLKHVYIMDTLQLLKRILHAKFPHMMIVK